MGPWPRRTERTHSAVALPNAATAKLGAWMRGIVWRCQRAGYAKLMPSLRSVNVLAVGAGAGSGVVRAVVVVVVEEMVWEAMVLETIGLG